MDGMGRPGRFRRRARVAATIGFVAGLGAPAALAPSAQAAPSIGAPSIEVPETIVRGGSSQAGVSVQATEDATFTLSVSGTGVASTLPSTCTPSALVLCSVDPATGAVTVGSDGDAQPEEAVTVTIIPSLTANSTQNLSSSEGGTPPGALRSVTATTTPTAATTGPGGSDSDTLRVISNPSTDAEIRLATTSPSFGLRAKPGTDVTFAATVTRHGQTNQATNAVVTLVGDTPAGTTVESENPTSVSFASGETSRDVSMTVDVPADAPITAATYHFTATWDPTGTDGGTTDTETGAQQTFDIVPGNDHFADGKVLSGANTSVNGTTKTATLETGEPSHCIPADFDQCGFEAGEHSVWYRWTAPYSGATTIHTCTAAIIDSVLAVYTGAALANLTRVAGNNNDCGGTFASRVTFQAEAGTEYRIAVSDTAEEAQNTFTLTIDGAEPPDSDGDGVIDESDECPNVPHESGCPSFERELTLRYRAKAKLFKGKVKSDEPSCVSQAGEVEILRIKDGTQKPIATADVTDDGTFKVKRKVRGGKFRARLAASLDPSVGRCLSAKSDKVKV